MKIKQQKSWNSFDQEHAQLLTVLKIGGRTGKKKLKIILHVKIIASLSVNMNIMEHAILNVLTQLDIK